MRLRKISDVEPSAGVCPDATDRSYRSRGGRVKIDRRYGRPLPQPIVGKRAGVGEFGAGRIQLAHVDGVAGRATC